MQSQLTCYFTTVNKEWTTRLQQRGDTWNCGIWIQEKWMQYWSQSEVTNALGCRLRRLLLLLRSVNFSFLFLK